MTFALVSAFLTISLLFPLDWEFVVWATAS